MRPEPDLPAELLRRVHRVPVKVRSVRGSERNPIGKSKRIALNAQRLRRGPARSPLDDARPPERRVYRNLAGNLGASIAEVARALEVNPNVQHRWRREFRQGPGNAFPGLGKRRWEEGRVAQLERKIGQQALVIDLLKWYLQRFDAQRRLQALTGKLLSTSRSKPRGREAQS